MIECRLNVNERLMTDLGEPTSKGDISCCPAERDTDVESGDIPRPLDIALDSHPGQARDRPDQLLKVS
jgi:hypothetical protein